MRPTAPAVPPVIKAPGKAPEDDGLVDVVEYLGRKGLKVARLAGGRFMLSGETVMMAELLGQVNRHRAEAGLTALSSTQVK